MVNSLFSAYFSNDLTWENLFIFKNEIQKKTRKDFLGFAKQNQNFKLLLLQL